MSIIKADIHITSSIKIAEAAKSIENAQRDINIAFANELALIFDKMDINTLEVLEAASTKWNFLSFKPGLVGGHCIGVDPYYLAHKSASYGHHPKLILSGREINDSMSEFIVDKVIRNISKNGNFIIGNLNILIMGITFKENCPDIRNTKSFDVFRYLEKFKLNIDVFDPRANKEEVKRVLGINLISKSDIKKYDAIIKLVEHDEFVKFNFKKILNSGGVVFDIRGSWKGKGVLTF